MRRYGGLKDKFPVTYWIMMIGTLAITGVGIPLTHIGFAGFLSKDAIIESAWAGGTTAAGFAFWALVVAALMTSFYSWRLMFLTFHGDYCIGTFIAGGSVGLVNDEAFLQITLPGAPAGTTLDYQAIFLHQATGQILFSNDAEVVWR